MCKNAVIEAALPGQIWMHGSIHFVRWHCCGFSLSFWPIDLIARRKSSVRWDGDEWDMAVNRRNFLRMTSAAFSALAASGCAGGAVGIASNSTSRNYGPLVADPNGLLDLPQGFSYRILSRLGDRMDAGGTVPDHADGMGCFPLGNGKIALVRNHELNVGQSAGADLASGYSKDDKGNFMPGGTTTLVLDEKTLAVERQFRSLQGTLRNCAGGTTPWGSWLTCEEPGGFATRFPAHGYVFEVPAAATGLVDPVPLKAMGRFNHEAAVVDPDSGIVYMTEDKDDGLFYRFIPATPGVLKNGGKLQALVVRNMADSRNLVEGEGHPVGAWYEATWVDIDDAEAKSTETRVQGLAKGATPFARGEGLFMGEKEMYFCCTNGGAKKLGQIYRLRPQATGPDRVQLFFESKGEDELSAGDNLVVAPNGHLIVCEDQYTKEVANHLRGITPDGKSYPLALCRLQTELAGACFSPDGETLFVNIFSPTATVAITGPWMA